jgi:hypothetical protein
LGNVTVDTKLWAHKITSKAALSYRSEVWTINDRNVQKLETAILRFLRPFLGLTRSECQRNSDICDWLKVGNLLEDIKSYQNWTDHLKWMNINQIPKLAFQYQPSWWQVIGRPGWSWRDRSTLNFKEIGLKT